MKKKILLVENDTVLAVLTKLELEDLGYDVPQIASTSEKAIEITLEKRPDLILMDVKLDSKMDGAEAAEQIQNHIRIPVIFLTGTSDSETVERCLASKPYGYLKKPCRREDLQEAIEQAFFQEKLLHRLKEEQIKDDLLRDSLTGLPNRIVVQERIRQALEEGQPFGLLHLDIDCIKQINNILGHDLGNRVLQLFAAKLEACKRHGDCVARLGSDEFAVFLNRVEGAQDALDHASHIQFLLKSPLVVNLQELFVTVSIGIVTGGTGYLNAENVLRDAETASQRAKALGKSRTAVFDRTQNSQILELFHLQNDLRKGLERNELAVFYQPIVQLDTNRISGFEALVRWNHPRLGLIGATEIIPLAQENGLILPIGKWVLEEACKQLAECQDTFDSSLSIHVNLSAKHLLEEDLVGEIKRILNETGVPPTNLKIEITEHFAIDYSESVLKTLTELQALNIGLQIDDFGTGYSSLSYLHQFPIDALKIDRSFVERVDADSGATEIVGMIVNLGKKLNLKIIAEGVETEEQLDQIQQMGCDQVQGYLFSVPLEAHKAFQLLTEFNADGFHPSEPFAA
ncbi:EAL domain-containing protein [bacterium]|nr:EAL domain-containing protein [bacterium]